MRARLERGSGVAAALVALAAVAWLSGGRPAEAEDAAPFRLADTGLYADFATRAIDPANLPFSPQYPLWTDGASKRRFIHLPPGTAIDAADPDAWVFPPGTKLWKEFAFDGRPVETRYMERRADGSWLYATYAWTEDGRDAVRAPDRGVPGAHQVRPGVAHDIPGAVDCRACHQGQPNEVLGFSALQLSPDRDPLAPHAAAAAGEVDLVQLARRGLLAGLPPALLEHPPRIVAPTPAARAAMGYLHGNCGGCHNARGTLATLGLSFEHTTDVVRAEDEPALRTTRERASAFRHPEDRGARSVRVRGGDPAHSVVVLRMGSRDPLTQMPPLGTRLVDDPALALVEQWIRDLR